MTRFNKLNVPNQWEHYWSKYPQGYTILEALLNWVAQVDSMVDNVNDWNVYLDDFVQSFDTNLQGTVTTTLSEWQSTGFLGEVINDALQTEIDSVSSLQISTQLQLQDKADKNAIFSMLNMGQDIKDAMLGGSVPIVGEGAVGTINLLDNAATTAKRSVLGEHGTITSTVPALIDLTQMKIYYSPSLTSTTHRVYYRGEYFDIPTGTTIDFSHAGSTEVASTSQLVGVWFSTSEYLVKLHDHKGTPQEDEILLGYIFRSTASGTNRKAHMFGEYTYTGDNSKSYDVGMFVADSPIEFDFVNSQMIIAGNTFLFGKGEVLTLLTGSYPFAEGGITFKFIHDPIRAEMYAHPYRDPYPSNHILVAVVRQSSQKVYINADYTINGKNPYLPDEVVTSDVMELGRMFNTLDDMIASWWVSPLAVRHTDYRDKTYMGYTDSQGYGGIASKNHETEAIEKRRLKHSAVDDHNPIAVDVMADGKIIVAYSTGHFEDNKLRVRISSKRESIEDFEEEIVLTSSNGNTTYAQLFYSSGKWWLFCRVGVDGWAGTYSTDEGLTWSPLVRKILADEQYYIKFRETTTPDLLRMVMYSNPNSVDVNIRQAFFDMTTGEVVNAAGVPYGTTDVDKDTIPIIIPLVAGKKQRLLDVAISPVTRATIAYATFTNELDGQYHVGTYENSSLSVLNLSLTGRAFYYSSRYYGGMTFKDEATLYLSRQDGTTANWYIEEWTHNGTAWLKTADLSNVTKGVAIRPTVDKNGRTLVWHEGYYSPGSYSNFQTDYKYQDIT